MLRPSPNQGTQRLPDDEMTMTFTIQLNGHELIFLYVAVMQYNTKMISNTRIQLMLDSKQLFLHTIRTYDMIEKDGQKNYMTRTRQARGSEDLDIDANVRAISDHSTEINIRGWAVLLATRLGQTFLQPAGQVLVT